MEIIQATKKFIVDIHDISKRRESIDNFDRLLLAGEHIKQEDIEKVSYILLNAIQKEMVQDIKEAILWPLATAATYYNVTEYMDWDVILNQIPLVSEVGIIRALNILYSSKRRDNINVLKKYLEYPSLVVRMMVLDVICQIRWNISDYNNEIEVSIRSKNYQYLQTIINTPERYDIPQAELEVQFCDLSSRVMTKVDIWLEKYDSPTAR